MCNVNYHMHILCTADQNNSTAMLCTTTQASLIQLVFHHHLKERNKKHFITPITYFTFQHLNHTCITHYWFHSHSIQTLKNKTNKQTNKHEISPSSLPNHHPPTTPHSKHHGTSMGQRRTQTSSQHCLFPPFSRSMIPH